MSKQEVTAAEIYKKVQRKVEKSMRGNQTTQNFFGTLKVNLDNIYVTQADGDRAVKELKRLSK